ncbi:hypothetical protein FRZ00_00620 [Streptomyces mobaraensis]|uniref:Uncharacterized protein n=1 Tax=Streptomyces mobaraensis TaxID=35621 RepID=A0A5N5WFC3_STRMB|nr:hypothetical protein FRZ00_00620 [Streptomyces mobaraensis]
MGHRPPRPRAVLTRARHAREPPRRPGGAVGAGGRARSPPPLGDRAAAELNNRPRESHGHRTPAEVYSELLTSGDALTVRGRHRLTTDRQSSTGPASRRAALGSHSGRPQKGPCRPTSAK